jgi:hypothetical protein
LREREAGCVPCRQPSRGCPHEKKLAGSTADDTQRIGSNSRCSSVRPRSCHVGSKA